MELTKEWLTEQYINQQKSFGIIAKEAGTYPNKIRRTAIQFGIPIRDKSSAQKNALVTGTSKHPTAGVGHSEDTKLKISDTVAAKWDNMSDEDREAHAERARQQMENLSPEKRQEMQDAAMKAVRVAAKEGSKLEKYVCERLTKAGYTVEYHRKGLVPPNPNLEIDIYLTDLATAIEIDGPWHFSPLFGEESLARTQVLDNKKNGLLRFYKVNVLRVMQTKKTASKRAMRDVGDRIMSEVQLIRKNGLPPVEDRFKEIKV